MRAIQVLLAGALAGPALAQAAQDTAVANGPRAERPGLLDRFRDPGDGWLDMSGWLLSRLGFLPVPFVITEPAVGFGGGVALAFFHGIEVPDDPWTFRAEKRAFTPDISVLLGGGTDNGTWFGGAAHLHSWGDDRVRTLSVLGAAFPNLTYFIGKREFAYEVDGYLLVQDARVRVDDSPLFLGGAYTYSDTRVTFDFGLPPGIDPDLTIRNGGLSAIAYWDTRSNYLNPENGQEAELKFTYFGEELGGSDQYTKLETEATTYHPVGDWILGARADLDAANGDVPFYNLPYVHLRGVPALRYQGDVAGAVEAEVRWKLHPRFRLVGFGGVGFADSDIVPDSGAIGAGGVGVRYVAARLLGLTLGIDVARGPEETVVYFTGGSGL